MQEKRVLFIVTVSLANLCSFLACCSLGLNGASSAVTNSSVLGGAWEAGQAIAFPRSLWFESEFLLGLIAQCHSLWLFQAAQSCVSGFTFRLWFMSLYGAELRTTCCLQFFLLLQRGV